MPSIPGDDEDGLFFRIDLTSEGVMGESSKLSVIVGGGGMQSKTQSGRPL